MIILYSTPKFDTVEERKAAYSRLMPNSTFLPNIKDLEEMGFFTAPASTKYHLNYEGGLFEHSMNVTKALLYLTSTLSLKWEEEIAPYIVGMYHDICKCDNYVKVDNHYEYNTHSLLSGHGEKSVMILSELMVLSEEEIACIRYHMGAFVDKQEWSYYTNAIHKYPNVLYTHTADMIAAHILEV